VHRTDRVELPGSEGQEARDRCRRDVRGVHGAPAPGHGRWQVRGDGFRVLLGIDVSADGPDNGVRNVAAVELFVVFVHDPRVPQQRRSTINQRHDG